MAKSVGKRRPGAGRDDELARTIAGAAARHLEERRDQAKPTAGRGKAGNKGRT